MGSMKQYVNQYRVVSADDSAKLSDKVNQLINGGWQPWGDLNIKIQGHLRLYTQVMVK